jgi:hypothetical protein
LWLYVKSIVKKPERHYHDATSNNGLRNPEHYSESKKRPAPRAVADSFRARDERGDRIVEAKNTDLADDIRRRPGNGEYAERRRPEYPRDEKCEDTAEIRRQHRDRVQEGAALEFYSGLVYSRRCVCYRRRDIERNVRCAH